MSALVSTLPRIQSRLRALRAGVLVGGPGAAVHQAAAALGRVPGPARAQLRLDAEPWGESAPGALDLAAWHDQLVALAAWRGPCPLSIVAGPDLDLAAQVARFARRLDFFVELCLSEGALCGPDGSGLRPSQADGLIDLDPEALRLSLGAGAPPAALAALAVIAASKQRRGSNCRVFVSLRWEEGAPATARAAAQAAAAAGLGPVQLEPAPRARRAPSAEAWAELVSAGLAAPLSPALERAVERMFAADDGEPGAPHAPGRCPVGGLRVELRADGSAWSCPFQAPLRPAGDARPLDQAWAAGAACRSTIAACGRRCAHPSLSPT